MSDRTVKLVYKVYEVLEGGTLRMPIEEDYKYSSPVYSEWGYDSVEKAMAAIQQYKAGHDLVILPSICWELETDQ